MSLLNLRHNLSTDRALGILRINEIEVVRGDGHGQLGISQLSSLDLGLGKIGDMSLELIKRDDTVPELPVPVIPVVFGTVIPRALSRRVESFQLVHNVIMSRDCWH